MGRLAAGFVLRHPTVKLEITVEDRSVDMVEEGYDLAIRVDPDPDELAACIAGDCQALNSVSMAGCAGAARSA